MTEQPTLAPPGIFKAYDIRGLYGDEMDETTALAIGRAFARVLARLRGKQPSELKVGLGRDMRLTAPSMAAELRDGLIFEGATVFDAGMVATEMLYHLVGSRELDGGAMVTASHNPKAYTGVKLVREGALALSGDAGIGDVKREIEAGLGPAPGGGYFEEVDVWDEYRTHALSFVDRKAVRPMVIVVDGGNGMAGPMVGPILRELGQELDEMYFVPDGEFPDHEPNPLLEENRQLIIERVRASGADLGIAWDGDADRCFFIDGDGTFCDGDFICALLARAALAANPGATILYDPRSSRAVPDLVAAEGGRSDLSRVGHAFFKIRMRETGAVFGGEVSGHYYFRDFWCADSGTIPALLMLELLSADGRSLAELMSEFRSRYFISGEINSEVDDPVAKMEQIAALHSKAEITRLDGISVDYPEWHFNVRPSNTEPLLRLNLESLISREDMERKRDEVLGLIRA
ncbi:MAG TPA: phosphomannomutase/phosphoglucomutase [Solirubrobacterales bacterium]|nr:phosphomannomutase/phosphoglucomutase [Solirubrobacterales bacterium]